MTNVWLWCIKQGPRVQKELLWKFLIFKSAVNLENSDSQSVFQCYLCKGGFYEDCS